MPATITKMSSDQKSIVRPARWVTPSSRKSSAKKIVVRSRSISARPSYIILPFFLVVVVFEELVPHSAEAADARYIASVPLAVAVHIPVVAQPARHVEHNYEEHQQDGAEANDA